MGKEWEALLLFYCGALMMFGRYGVFFCLEKVVSLSLEDG